MRRSVPFYLTLLAAGFAPLFEGGTTHLPVLILKIIILTLLGVTVFGEVKRGTLSVPNTPLDLAAILFSAATLLSLLIAPYKYMALTWVQLIIYYILFFYLATAALSCRDYINRAALFIMLMGVFEASAGVYQWLNGTQRVTGTFFNPNMLAGYVASAVLVAVSLLVFNAQGYQSRQWKSLLVLTVVIGMAAIVMTGSRGGMLCLSAGLFIVFWHRSRVLAYAVATALVVSVLVIPNPVRDRIFHGDQLAYTRLDIWSNAVDRVKDHPMGLGLGNFKYYSEIYKIPVDEVSRYDKTARTAHNEYLHFGSEMGVAGMLVMAFALFMLARTMASSVRTADGGGRPLAIGVSGGVAAILVHSCVDSNLHEPGTVFMLILLAATGIRLGNAGELPERTALIPADARNRFGVIISVFLVVMAAWAAVPDIARYYHESGVSALKEGKLEEGERLADLAITLDPGNAAYHEQKASALFALYARSGEIELLQQSLDELDLAGSLNPNLSKYPALKAGLESGYAEQLEDPAKKRAWLGYALNDISHAAALAPYDAGVLYRQAMVLVSLGRPADAVRILERLKDIEPNYLRGRLLLARMYYSAGRRELSKAECYSILDIHNRYSGDDQGQTVRKFVSVDMGSVNALLKELGDGKG